MKKFHLLRLLVVCISVFALSKFFEAGKEIAYCKSIVSFLVFAFTVLVMGYWIYKEEKEKNNLRVRFGLYEWFLKRKTKNEQSH